MIGARVRVVNEGTTFTTVVFAESLREVEQIAKIRYPGSTVRITFPIEPECSSLAVPIPVHTPVSRQWKG